MSQKTFFIIPGLGETIDDYTWLVPLVSKKYKVIFLDFDFKNITFKDMIATKLEKDSIVFGFSIGGLIAYKLESTVARGIYCSISNVLGVDAINNKKHIIDIFGKKITEEFLNTDYDLPNARKYVVFCGDKEIDATTLKFPNLKIVKNTGHEFTDNYKELVLNEIFK